MTISTGWLRLLPAAFLAVALTGCGLLPADDEPDQADIQPTSPYALDGCVRVDDGQMLSLPNIEDAPPTQGVLLGDARRAIIFAPSRDGNVCEWLSLGKDLAQRGYGVALYNHNGKTAGDQQLASVIADVRRRGAQSVVLVGASDAACTSLMTAAAVRPSVNGVVAVSPQSRMTGPQSIADHVRQLRVPLLFASAANDAGSSAVAARAYEQAAPAGDKRVMVVSGSSFGVDLFSSADGATVQAAVESFFKAHSAD